MISFKWGKNQLTEPYAQINVLCKYYICQGVLAARESCVETSRLLILVIVKPD